MKRKHIYALVMVAIAAFAFFLYVQTVQSKEFEHSLQIVLEYEDGSTQSFNPEKLPLFSQSIVDQTGKTVKNMRVELYVKADYEGNAAGWDVSGALGWKILDSAKNVKHTINMALQPRSENVAPPNKQAFVVASSTVSAADIEALWSGWIVGQTYYLRFEVQSLRFTIRFVDGTAQTKTASAAFEWQFKYVSSQQFNSLSVTWQPVTYY